MKRVLNFRVVEGDPNEIDKNEILLVRDNSTGKVKSIRERGSDGSLKELIPDDYIYCRVKSWQKDLTNGQDISLLKFGETGYGPIISSSLVNFSLFENIYAPFNIIGSSSTGNIGRYTKVNAIRIQKFCVTLDENNVIKINTLDDLQNIVKLLSGKEMDFSKALKPITKDEFDSMEVPTLPF